MCSIWKVGSIPGSKKDYLQRLTHEGLCERWFFDRLHISPLFTFGLALSMLLEFLKLEMTSNDLWRLLSVKLQFDVMYNSSIFPSWDYIAALMILIIIRTSCYVITRRNKINKDYGMKLWSNLNETISNIEGTYETLQCGGIMHSRLRKFFFLTYLTTIGETHLKWVRHVFTKH